MYEYEYGVDEFDVAPAYPTGPRHGQDGSAPRHAAPGAVDEAAEAGGGGFASPISAEATAFWQLLAAAGALVMGVGSHRWWFLLGVSRKRCEVCSRTLSTRAERKHGVCQGSPATCWYYQAYADYRAIGEHDAAVPQEWAQGHPGRRVHA